MWSRTENGKGLSKATSKKSLVIFELYSIPEIASKNLYIRTEFDKKKIMESSKNIERKTISPNNVHIITAF